MMYIALAAVIVALIIYFFIEIAKSIHNLLAEKYYRKKSLNSENRQSGENSDNASQEVKALPPVDRPPKPAYRTSPAAKPFPHQENEYFKNTGKTYLNIAHNKGEVGEYLIYEALRKMRGYKKFLFNLYIPCVNGMTTEIDVIMIHTSGIYVFESKNYSGWIFGSENQQYWTQCLYNRRGSEKHKFYNPVIQNKNHIKHLKKLLTHEGNIPVYSFVVFSERCELKKINVNTDNCAVIKRNYLYYTVKLKADFAGNILTEDMTDKIYNILLPYSKASEEVKKKHIDDINTLRNT